MLLIIALVGQLAFMTTVTMVMVPTAIHMLVVIAFTMAIVMIITIIAVTAIVAVI